MRGETRCGGQGVRLEVGAVDPFDPTTAFDDGPWPTDAEPSGCVFRRISAPRGTVVKRVLCKNPHGTDIPSVLSPELLLTCASALLLIPILAPGSKGVIMAPGSVPPTCHLTMVRTVWWSLQVPLEKREALNWTQWSLAISRGAISGGAGGQRCSSACF